MDDFDEVFNKVYTKKNSSISLEWIVSFVAIDIVEIAIDISWDDECSPGELTKT